MERLVPQLGKIRLPDPRMSDAAALKLSKITGVERTVRRQGWSGYSGLIYKDTVFVATYTHSKPPRERIVAWPADEQAMWLPSESATDLAALCSHLNETTVFDFAIWHEFVCVDYGLAYKGVPPILVDVQAARTFDIAVTMMSECEKGETVFWQAWGGKLFSIQLLDDADGILKCQHRCLGSSIGAYNLLPFHIVR